MNPRDPFEYLQDRNPIPPGDEPGPPMALADRIVGRSGALMPAWALAAAAALTVLGVGLGSLLLVTGGSDDVVASSSTPTTEAPPTTATPPPPTTSTTISPTTQGTVPDPAACSGREAGADLTPQPALPDHVAALRAQIFEAARRCDWETLASLQVNGFTYSFGGGNDPIGYWQALEADESDRPMFFLAELLNRPFGTMDGGDRDYHVWPSAFADEWAAIPEAEREALRPLYDDEDFAAFAEWGGYFGYRVGVIDGEWYFFVAGD